MKISSPFLPRITGILIGLVLLAFLVSQTSCSSTHHAGKGKRGMVPCPCDKRSYRR